jgi:uncharacterized 2Fe-2S/4Fe-4S cluster protein (DUF4445 family)
LADRLLRAIRRQWNLEEVSLPLSLAGGLAGLYAAAGYRVWVVCRVEGRRGRLVSVARSDPGGLYALAVDVGSTTLVLALVDLERPSVKDQLTLPNPQAEYGEDILTRVHYAERPQGFETLSRGLKQAINHGTEELCRRQGLHPSDLAAAALAGNTTMTHFLLGLPVRTLVREPYVPVLNCPEEMTAGGIGLNLSAEAPVLIMPNKGSYFGGDLMAGLVVAGLARAEKPCLMVDVGTNAEVVLGQKDWLVGAAGAAGPALEGGVASMGMVAGPGAIDQVRIARETGEVTWRTIDGEPPRGICGSGLIDLFAELFLSGAIDFQGKLTLPEGHPRRAETDEGPAFVVVPSESTAHGRPILLSEVEIDILTRSKAGMFTILSTVLSSVGLTFDQIDKFYVAGTFGQYIDPRMAVAVGMVPDIPLDRYVSLGNSSLKGVVLSLVSAGARQEIQDVWQRLTYLEMNVNQDLMNRFSAARFIPHTDRKLFPSVGTSIV